MTQLLEALRDGAWFPVAVAIGLIAYSVWYAKRAR